MNKINCYGFSLLELLISMAIMGILVSIAYPAYTDYLVHVRRAAANVILADLAARLEQFYETNNSYQNASLSGLSIKDYTNDGFYKLNIEVANDNEYQISATPQKSQQTADQQCGILSINQSNEKTASKSKNPEVCWQ